MRKTLHRLSFRSRLALTITAVFIAAGVALMAVEYFLVSSLFSNAVQTVAISVASSPAATYSVDSVPPYLMAPALTEADAGADAGGEATPILPSNTTTGEYFDSTQPAFGGTSADLTYGIQAGTMFVAQSNEVGDEVLTGLLVWSGIALVVFAGLAAVAASWLARRSLRRIGEVTAMAKEVSTSDLHRRLDLPGPIDEIKELADTIDQMLERLESAFATQDRFVANASHELRTPLTTSRTALEIPLSQGRVPADLEPAFRTALRAGEHSEKLISALLHLSRGVDRVELEETDLDEIISVAVEAVQPSAAVAAVDIRINSASTMVIADPTMLIQAVTNLLDNGIRHNVPDGFVQLDLEQVGNETVLTVVNSGRVIGPEVVDLLCEPFYRADETRISSHRTSVGTGVGLGLSIVNSVVKAHRGRLSIAARPEGGLIVVLALSTVADMAGISVARTDVLPD